MSGSVVAAQRARDRYGLVLALLVVNYLLATVTTGAVVATVRTVLFTVTLLLAMRFSHVSRGTELVVVVLAAVGMAGSVGLVVARSSDLALGILDAWTSLLLFVVVLVIVRRLMALEIVTVQTILGALSAYLLIGLMFAALYGALSKLGGTPFFAGGRPARSDTLQYFSFTTLTTLGYGDFTAASGLGRAIAVLEALLGQVFLITLVAHLVALVQPRRGRAARQRPRRGHRNADATARPQRPPRNTRGPH